MEEVAHMLANQLPFPATPIEPQNHPFPSLAPQLVILAQRPHSEEQISKNGIAKNILIIVKNSPFHITLGVANSTQRIDFNQIAFDCNLLYDCEGEKEVDYVKAKPFDFKSTPSDNGQELDVELRIKVLTSQHEDMLFKAKIQGYHPVTRQEIVGLSLTTAPIKVISKPEQLKKKLPSKKRTVTDMLLETISRIEQKQSEQQKIIDRMMSQQQTIQPMATEKRPRTERFEESLAFWEEVTNPEDKQPKEGKKELPTFESAFTNLIKAYNSMKAEEKPDTIRKLIRTSSTRDTERLSELLDLFWTDGLQKEPAMRVPRDRFTANNTEGCSCTDCPHKAELERIDEFYKEFLSSNVNIPTQNPHF